MNMNEIRKEFLDIVTQVRRQLELQIALGVSTIEAGSRSVLPVAVPPASVDAASPARSEKTTPPPDVADTRSLSEIQTELSNCTRCKLCENRKNLVFGEGNARALLVFVGEGPGQEEDEQGRPFVGAAGQLLTDIIVKGMQLERQDVYICNIVKCRPPENRNPEPDEIKACEPFLVKQLKAIKPEVIVALGNVPTKTLLRTDEGITALRGKWKSYEGIRLMPTFHPAYLLRNPSGKRAVWEDIKKVMAELEKFKDGGKE